MRSITFDQINAIAAEMADVNSLTGIDLSRYDYPANGLGCRALARIRHNEIREEIIWGRPSPYFVVGFAWLALVEFTNAISVLEGQLLRERREKNNNVKVVKDAKSHAAKAEKSRRDAEGQAKLAEESESAKDELKAVRTELENLCMLHDSCASLA